MAGAARDGLIRVVPFERMSALMMAAGAVLSEGVLLALIATANRLETLLVGTVVVILMSLAMLPLSFRLPARRRHQYEHAVRIDSVAVPLEGQDASRRQSLWRTAVAVGVLACWMMLLGLTFHEVMPPVMLVPLAVLLWARSRATAHWERVNGAALWQGVPGLLGSRGPVFRVPAAGGI
ncbi:hypothetical protein GCM10011579_078420 [Streptomyces albiflavescens]|uniref:Uncharacterized protein n=1 Tax=Streptomyces albiflavescens TaxID=1623582 RepID=A0A918D8K0_9ACTN|nr:hypothetical protein [Streptomyces albiflavescens]GGN86528.1 hypothetical protein GCM10011579_078420 [Streptomyces albiflavescens]